MRRRHTIPFRGPRRPNYEVLESDLDLVVTLVRECGFAHKRMAAVMWEAKDGRRRDGERMRKTEVRYYFAVARRAYSTLGYNITDFRNANTESAKERLDECLKQHWASFGRKRRKVQG